jgi:hypothetical protein
MSEHSAYIESIRTYQTALETALEIVKDPYKAPELNVFEANNSVLPAIWNMQVEYTAMMRISEREAEKEKEGNGQSDATL